MVVYKRSIRVNKGFLQDMVFHKISPGHRGQQRISGGHGGQQEISLGHGGQQRISAGHCSPHEISAGHGGVQEQQHLLFTINCGGHIGKVGQSRTKLDNFEKKWIFVDIFLDNFRFLTFWRIFSCFFWSFF